MSRREAKSAQPDPAQHEMTLTEHLAELRMRIIRAGLAIMVGGIVVLALYDHVLSWMLQPYQDLCARKPAEFCGRSVNPETGKVVLFNLDPLEGLTTRLKSSFYGGLILALPVVLWQVWRFIVPALHKTEREAVRDPVRARLAGPVPARMRASRYSTLEPGARVPDLAGRARTSSPRSRSASTSGWSD